MPDGLTRPRALRPGDRVAIVAPSSPFQPEHLERGAAWLRGHGFEPVWSDSLTARARYLAGPDALRAQALMDAFLRDDVQGVLCARGGYGAARLLPYLDVGALRPHCKVFVGFSDVTTLHLFLMEKCGWVTFHGPMVATRWAGEGFDDATAASMLQAITQAQPGAPVAAPQGLTLHGGQARGRLVGGNLSLLCHSIGTSYELDTDGALLLVEDVHEAPYRIDRMLTHLRQAGKLTGVRGIVVGEMHGCEASESDGYTVLDVVTECLADLQIPVVADFPISHGKPNHTVALGVSWELDGDARTLTPLEAGVVD